MANSAILSFFQGAFRPPFKGLPLLVWLFFVFAFFVHPESPLVLGAFWDSDDYVHFVRIIDWFEGQSWFDQTLVRMAPPEGVTMHFSRLAELPIAALMWPAHQLGLSWQMAAYVTSCVYPLLLFAVFLWVTAWTAREIVSPAWSNLTAPISLFAANYATFQFSMGRVDHHGIAIIVVVAALGCVLRFVREPKQWMWAIGAAFFLALGQSVALDVVLWVVAFSLWIGLWAVFSRAHAVPAMIFGGSLYGFSNALLALAVDSSHFFDMNPVTYSYVYVFMTQVFAVVFVFAALFSRMKRLWLRVALVGFIAITLGAFFFQVCPSLVTGPYGAIDPTLARLLFSSIGEALPKLTLTHNFWQLLAYSGVPLMGFASCFLMMGKDRDNYKIWNWFAMSSFILIASFLGLYYQQRINTFANLFAIFPLVVLVQRGWAIIGQTLQGRARFGAELGLLCLVGPLLGVFLPAVLNDLSFAKGVLLFPVHGKPSAADMKSGLWILLTSPEHYGDKPRLIMSMFDTSGPILFHTKHQVLAAPYHTNVSGNIKSMSFLLTKDPAFARDVLQKSGADLVLVREKLCPFYRHRPKAGEPVSENGKIILTEDSTFAEQLAGGKIPDWLKPVTHPDMGDYLLFEVIKSGTQKTTP